jgi:hypothetical protein
MTLRVCQGCTTRFAVGLLACPHCRSTEHYEEGSVMPKITVHGGPSNASDPASGPVTVGERKPEPVSLPEDTVVVSVSVDGVDQGPGEVVEFEGDPSFGPLPEAVEDDTTEHVPEPDYDALTKTELQELLAARELPTSGTKAELVARLRTHDEP